MTPGRSVSPHLFGGGAIRTTTYTVTCANCGAEHPYTSDICPGCGLSGGQK